jgi:hypothetical protein
MKTMRTITYRQPRQHPKVYVGSSRGRKARSTIVMIGRDLAFDPSEE